MKFLNINFKETLSSLANKVGQRNVQDILNVNSLERIPAIGKQLQSIQNSFINGPIVSVERKSAILNTLTGNTDIFEKAALASEKDWKVLSGFGSFLGSLMIPEAVKIADSVNLLGNNQFVPKGIYEKTIQSLIKVGNIDAAIFNEFSTRRDAQVVNVAGVGNPMQWFNLPWGKITLYSSLGGDSIDFPCYPEEYNDGVSASYDTMPDMLYQFEPWYLFKSSGPRSNSYSFKFHRDLWSGDHRDGKANQLITFCKANCYPEFKGATVNSAIVILFIAGKPHIRGVMTSVKDSWSGPIGIDGKHLVCELTIDITEVSERPLNYAVVRRLEMI